jgi:hypothetical protein
MSEGCLRGLAHPPIAGAYTLQTFLGDFFMYIVLQTLVVRVAEGRSLLLCISKIFGQEN